MKYPWNLKTDSNADATYGVLAASVSISRTEDGNEIPQFEIDFSGVTKRATFYDIIYAYKTKESLGVQNSDTVEYLLPCLPVARFACLQCSGCCLSPSASVLHVTWSYIGL